MQLIGNVCFEPLPRGARESVRFLRILKRCATSRNGVQEGSIESTETPDSEDHDSVARGNVGATWYWLTCLIVLVSLSCTRAQSTNRYIVGVRGGFTTINWPSPFVQTEMFATIDSKFDWNLGRGWRLKPRHELTAGSLYNQGVYGFVGTLGPSFRLRHAKSPFIGEVGSRLTMLSRRVFPARDFGINFQFTTHVGLDWIVGEHWLAGYRFQHMSNAGLGTPNPGLNMQMLSMAYRF